MADNASDKKRQFNANRNQAKVNLTRKLGRNPTAAEILGLVGTRRKGLNENSFLAGLMKKAENRAAAAAEVKMAAKAAAAEVRMKQKAAVEEKKLAAKANAVSAKAEKKGEGKVAKTAMRALTMEMKRAAAAQNKLVKKEAKGLAKAAKEAAREAAKEQFSAMEASARNNLTMALGRPPRVANIRRLASIRHSGVNLSVNDFLRVKNYAMTRKANAKGMTQKRMNLGNANLPVMDPCEACELKKFLERENA
jgi:hypothetical protein